MQFTPQQMTGGPRFSHSCRIGNWTEDLELKEIQLKDYLKQKENGSLLVNAKQRQLEESLQRMELSTTEDGQLHFGDKVMLFNHQSQGFLCANPHESVPKPFEAYMLNTGPNNNGCVRNVFELVRADPGDGFPDDVVHYGQNFRLRMYPFSKIRADVYMMSEHVTALSAAKFSRHQEVVASSTPNGETLWQILYPETQSRFEMQDEPVPAGAPCVFRHVHTGSFLASDRIPYHNIFGQECEVHCFAYYSTNKTQNLTSEKKGDITGDYQLRRQGLPNIWTVVTGNVGLPDAAAERPADLGASSATALPGDEDLP